jgi:hypothetical protein
MLDDGKSTSSLLSLEVMKVLVCRVTLCRFNSDHDIYPVIAVPLQAWSDPEGSRELRFPDYMTTAQDVGKVVSLTHRSPLPPGNAPGTHFC